MGEASIGLLVGLQSENTHHLLAYLGIRLPQSYLLKLIAQVILLMSPLPVLRLDADMLQCLRAPLKARFDVLAMNPLFPMYHPLVIRSPSLMA